MLPGCLFAIASIATLAQAPDQRLTRASARLAHQFSSLAGLRELGDGRVMVSDGIDQVLIRADFATQRIDTVGRPGQGPGEYRSPDLLLPLPGGATLVFDLGNARLTVFDAGGKYRESFPIAQGGAVCGRGPLRLLMPRAADADGRLYYQPPGADPAADSGVVIRWDRVRGRHDTVARVRLPRLITKTSGTANSRNVRQRPPPYPQQDAWVAMEDGRVALVRVAPYRVDWVLPNGSRVIGRPLPAPAVPIGPAERKEYLEEQAATGLAVAVESVNGQVSMRLSRGRQDPDEDRGADLDDGAWPSTKPPTTGVVLPSPDGTVWVERSGPAGAPRAYDVIGARGEPVRRVTLPAGRRAIGVGRRGLYARYQDDNGIGYLERFDVR